MMIKKILAAALTAALALTMCVGSTGTVFAADQTPLSVTITDSRTADGVSRTFTDSELKSMAKECSFSFINHYGTVEGLENTRGIQLDELFAEAGISVDKTDALKVYARDGSTNTFFWSEFGSTRYYYPKLVEAFEKNTALTKGPIDKSLQADCVEVRPALISEGSSIGTLDFGQAYISNRNKPYCLQKVATGGTIEIIKAGKRKTWKPANVPSIKSNKKVTYGKTLSFKEEGIDGYIYYTSNGVNPDEYSAVDNYNTFNFGEGPYNHYVFNKIGSITIKTKVMGFGKNASKVTTLKYTVVPAKPKLVLTGGTKAFQLEIANETGADKYTVKYKAKGKSWKTVTMKGSSRVFTKIKKGKCSVKVTAVKGKYKSSVASGTVSVK